MNFILKCSKTFPIGPSVVLHLLHHIQHFLSLIINISENHHKIVLQSRYGMQNVLLLSSFAPPDWLSTHRRATGQVVSQHILRLVFHSSSSHYCPPPLPLRPEIPSPPLSVSRWADCLLLSPPVTFPVPLFYTTMFTNRRNFCRISGKGSLYTSREIFWSQRRAEPEFLIF